jgi:putative addiction module killer protein
VLPYGVLVLRYYLTSGGESPFGSWFSDLDAAAAAEVSVALVRLEQGNTSNAKGVGEGVLEYRIDWGPGYRVYFGRDGETLVILLTGGTKAAPATRHRKGERVVGGLQAAAQAARTMIRRQRWR